MDEGKTIDIIQQDYGKLMHGFNSLQFIKSDWELEDGLYRQYSAYDYSVPCVSGASGSIKAV